jgi:protein-tyrosine-phosphatase
MIESIKKYCEDRIAEFGSIADERKQFLEKITNYIRQQLQNKKNVNLVYICTHNSRRSFFGQVWGQVAAHYYNVHSVKTFSGGTEVTFFHPHAVSAFERIGFNVSKSTESANPVYHLKFSNGAEPVVCFSKTFDDKTNPQKNFAAIMVCSDAEQNCPFVPGIDLRVLTSYNDPKEFDNTPGQNSAYDERCRQIARESLYVFSLVK